MFGETARPRSGVGRTRTVRGRIAASSVVRTAANGAGSGGSGGAGCMVQAHPAFSTATATTAVSLSGDASVLPEQQQDGACTELSAGIGQCIAEAIGAPATNGAAKAPPIREAIIPRTKSQAVARRLMSKLYPLGVLYHTIFLLP